MSATADTTAPTLTPRQCEILQHALGLGDASEGRRNYYVTDEGSDDFPDCERLVALGLMTRHSRSWVPGFIYLVTPSGTEQAQRCA